MEQKYVERFRDRKDQLREKYSDGIPGRYRQIVEDVIELISDEEYADPDPERIQSVDWGDYQGTRVFIIGGGGYQPKKHWYVRVSYGSCSGCDALLALRGYGSEPPEEKEVDGALRMALHVVQNLEPMEDPGYI